MNIKVRANLLEKTVIIDGEETEVYGLADFCTRPMRKGIGKHCMEAFIEMAERDGKRGIVGFCESDSYGFYRSIGCWFHGKYEGKNLFTTFPVQSIIVKEVW